jgi:hypothetical protein
MCKSRTKSRPASIHAQAHDGSGLCGKNPRQSKDRFSQNCPSLDDQQVLFYRQFVNMLKSRSLHSHPFVILRPDNPDYTARDVMAARVMSPFGALKDKCIQTH